MSLRLSRRVRTGTAPYSTGAPGATNWFSVTPASSSALIWATMPNSSNGPVAPPIGQLEITTGTRRREIAINFAAVSSTICSGLLTTQVMNDSTGFSWKASSPPATISPSCITSSNASRLVRPACTCLVMLFRLAKNLLTSLLRFRDLPVLDVDVADEEIQVLQVLAQVGRRASRSIEPGCG